MTGPRSRAALQVLVLVALGTLIQTVFAPDMRVNGVAPDFMMLIAVCAGLAGGPEPGAAVGFLAGLASDLFLVNTPFGLSTLAACLAGFSVGWARANLLRPHVLLTPVIVAAGTVLGVVAFVVIGYLVGQSQLVAPGKTWLVQQAVVEGCYSAVFAIPVAALMGWALRGLPGAPSSVQTEGAVNSWPA